MTGIYENIYSNLTHDSQDLEIVSILTETRMDIRIVTIT